MTGKRLAVVAAIVMLLTVTGIAARPLFTARPSTPTRTPPTPRRPAPIGVDILADTAVSDALRCPPRRDHHQQAQARWCGRLTVTRRQTDCLNGLTCHVDVLGTIATATTRIPIALTVTLHLDPTGWRAVEVSS